MKIIGQMVVGPGESKRFLDKSLPRLQEICDDVVVLLNNVDADTHQYVLDTGVRSFEDNREWGTNQHLLKQKLVDLVISIGADWVLTADADEVFDESITREDIEALADKGGSGFNFYIINLYDDGYTPDWSFWNVRMYQCTDEWSMKMYDQPLHCGSAPEVAMRTSNYSPFIVWHYGLKNKKDRDKKVARYEKYDPEAKYKGRSYYQFLSSNLTPTPVDTDKLRALVADEVRDYKHTFPNMNKHTQKYFYVRATNERKIDPITGKPMSKLIDVPEHSLKHTLRQSGKNGMIYELVNEDGLSLKEESKPKKKPVKKEESEAPKEDNVCEECGFVAKNAFGLKAHARKHN